MSNFNKSLPDPLWEKAKKEHQAMGTKIWRKDKHNKLRQKAKIDFLVAEAKSYLSMETVNFIERRVLLHKSNQWSYAEGMQ